MLFKLPEGKLQKNNKRRMQADSERMFICQINVSSDRKIISTMQVVFPSKLHCRSMQMTRIKSLLENRHYEAMIPISGEVKTELRWQINQLEFLEGKSIKGSNTLIILTLDA